MEESKEWFVELDLIRGLAIALMVTFHLLWDLDYYGLSPLDKHIYWYAQIVPVIFFLLVGMCLTIAAQHKTRNQLIFRGAIILGIGFIITIISQIIIPDKPVTFGVLHCIGVSMILGAFFIKRRVSVVYASIAFISFGSIIDLWHINQPNIIQLAIGLHQTDLWRYTVDYFPIFPWFGVVLFGMAIANVLYADGKRHFPFPDISKYVPVKIMSWLGKNSLTIYLAHQPVIAGTLIYVIPYVTPMLAKYI
jgi:uncharacterized membrane protein